MSRYLELDVPGALDMVAERSRRAFRSVGRVRRYDPASLVEGVVRTEGRRANVTVTWGPARTEGQIHLDIRASTRDPSSRGADAALYAFVRAYRATDWPDPDAESARRRRVTIGVGIAAGVGVLATVAALLIAR